MDPKKADLYHPEDKRNPGEQGFFTQNPTSASMHIPSAAGPRSRGRLVVFAQTPRCAVRASGNVQKQPVRAGGSFLRAQNTKLLFA